MAVNNETDVSSHNAPSTVPVLDISKLHSLPSEQQELYLLNHVTNSHKLIGRLEPNEVNLCQKELKKYLLQIITLPTPAASRIIRLNVGRCFADIYGKGDRKSLYEAINQLCDIVAGNKSEKNIRPKHAAVVSLGFIFQSAGLSALSISGLAVSVILRAFRTAQNHVGYRGSCLRSLSKIIRCLTQAIDETVARDIWKQARQAISNDKAFYVKSNACFCVKDLIRHTTYFDKVNDYDKLQTAILKAFDSPSARVRYAAAQTFASRLVKSYSETPLKDTSKVKKPRKGSKKQGVNELDEDAVDLSDSPAPEKYLAVLQFNLGDILNHLSSLYSRQASTNKVRAGIVACYSVVLKDLGPRVVEAHYGEIHSHLSSELLDAKTTKSTKYRQLLTRKLIAILLEDTIGKRILSEEGQLAAIRYLINDVLKDYPQTLKERNEPKKETLVSALSALRSLLQLLGCAAQPISEACRDSLLMILQHPSYTVRIYASACMKCLVVACPHMLVSAATICLNNIKRELSQLSTSRDASERSLGFAYGLSAITSTAEQFPIYGSTEVYSQIFSQATALLKSSSSSDLITSGTQIQIAWILLGGLMSLGPNFVKIHLPQLLLLWKNALAKPSNNDNRYTRDLLELHFLTRVRECALGSVFSFLNFNSKILTVDIVKRISVMIQNTVEFLHSLPDGKHVEDINQRVHSGLQLADLALMVQRRIFQCCNKLITSSSVGGSEIILQSSLLPIAISSFADPEDHIQSTLSTAIAGSTGSFDTIWDLSDSSAYGLTSLLRGFSVVKSNEDDEGFEQKPVNQSYFTEAIDDLLTTPIHSGTENDSVGLYTKDPARSDAETPPFATEVVDLAIRFFGLTLPLQTIRIQESVLEQVSSFMSGPNLHKYPARKAAITVNIAVALLFSLKCASKAADIGSAKFGASSVEKSIQDLTHTLIVDPDVYVRRIASQAVGLLCHIRGTTFASNEVRYLIDSIISNRDPTARAGCAGSLGAIFSQLGGMAAGFHLKDILGVLMSLSSDPHPIVHFWATDSIAKVAEAAGLSFSSHVSGLLGMAARIYLSDSHNEETDSLSSSNIEFEMPSPAVLARMLDSIIHVVGPELQELDKVRDMIFLMLNQLQAEDEIATEIEAMKAYNDIAIYAIGHIDVSWYVLKMQEWLKAETTSVRTVAINGLYNLTKKGTADVFSAAESGLETDLWLALNDNPENEMVRSIITNWFHDTALNNSTQWIENCQKVFTMSLKPKDVDSGGAISKSSTNATELQDEEVAGFAATTSADKDESSHPSARQVLKWQVRTYSIDTINDLLALLAKDSVSQGSSLLKNNVQNKIGDIIRLAFSASTSGNVALRLRGLRTINFILTIFGTTPDPDFAESTLLEQYQAQISSALTPAFAADSSPELAAEAIKVCATFIATGIVTEIERMGRIPKLLASALLAYTDESDDIAIGDLRNLSPNAQIIVKIAVFSAWAELQVSASSLQYLDELVKPHLVSLAPSWLEILREYARLRFEPDISASSLGVNSGDLAQTYSSLNRSTLLQFYQDSWLQLVNAITSLIDQDNEFILHALDDQKGSQQASRTARKLSDINYRSEPVAFFFLLYGIVFEALTKKPKNDSSLSMEANLELLQALQRILRPAIAGQSIYKDAIFTELLDVLGRLVLTSAPDSKLFIVRIAESLCLSHPSAFGDQRELKFDDDIADDVDQLFQATRIIVLALDDTLPDVSGGRVSVHASSPDGITDSAVQLVSLCISALVNVAEVYPPVIRTDLHACIMHIFVMVFSTPSCQVGVVPHALPLLKSFLRTIMREPNHEIGSLIRSMVVQLLQLLKIAQRREFSSALQCEKNAMLGLTVVITTCSGLLAANDPILQKSADELLGCLGHQLTTKIAAGCCRSLLVQQERDAVMESVVASLFPKLVDFYLNPPEAVEGLSETVTLIGHIFTLFASTLPAEKAATAITMMVPVFLVRAKKNGSGCYGELSKRFLDLANVDSSAFRGVVMALAPDDRSSLEEILGHGRQNQRAQGVDAAADGAGSEPSIALKTDFGV